MQTCVRGSKSAGTAGVSLKRIRSVPGNRVLPVRSSAIIHPTDQISTEKEKRGRDQRQLAWHFMGKGQRCVSVSTSTTCHVVMHPVQHDLRCTVPASGHVAGHLVISVPCQTKVQNLGTIERGREKNRADWIFPFFLTWCCKWEEAFADLQLTVFIHGQITRFQILQRGKPDRWITGDLIWLGDEESLHLWFE